MFRLKMEKGGQASAMERGFPSKPGILRNGSSFAFETSNVVAPNFFSDSLARLGSSYEIRCTHDERWVCDKEVACLQHVFNEILVIAEERLAKNREQWNSP